MKTKKEFRIGNRSDALALISEMTAKCEKIGAVISKSESGANKAICSLTSHLWPRLEALKDAVERGII